MAAMGLAGVVRGQTIRTTASNPATLCPQDRVNRQFHAPRPNALGLSDFTYVATRAGFVYVASGAALGAMASSIIATGACNMPLRTTAKPLPKQG